MALPRSEQPFYKYRSESILLYGGIRSLRSRDWNALKQIEIFPGYPLGGLLFVIPEADVPPGNQRKIGQRTIDATLSGALSKSVSVEVASQREEWVGRAILSFWLPTGSMRGDGLQAWSFRSRCLALLRIVDASLATMPADDGDLWPHVLGHQRSDFLSITFADRSRSDMHSACDILASAADNRLMPKRPPPPVPASRDLDEQGYGGVDPSTQTANTKKIKKKKPFSDKFVTELLSRAFWIQDNLADNVISMLSCYVKFVKSKEFSLDQLRGLRKNIMENHEWLHEDGTTSVQLPFPIKQRIEGNRYELSIEWPPAQFSTIKLISRALQMANLWTLAFCTAARIHEIHGFKLQGHLLFTEGVINARTYKHSGRRGGKLRDWPLHPRAAKALHIQEQLALLFREDGADHLWVTLKQGDDPIGSPLSNASGASVSVVEYLDLSALSEGRPHLHRWRHTAARIIGITVERAPEVLMDLFGTNYEGVLTYLLSDPEIAAESIRVAEEAMYALAAVAVQECEQGVSSGAASRTICDGIDNLKMSRGIRALGTDEINEAVEQLVVEGAGFQIVRRGVICTKLSGEFGPCTQKLHRPDKGSCHADCVHRFEMAAEKQQCRRQLDALLEMIQHAIADEKTMVVEHLKGQIIYELKRWDEVRADVLAKSGFARALWHEAST